MSIDADAVDRALRAVREAGPRGLDRAALEAEIAAVSRPAEGNVDALIQELEGDARVVCWSRRYYTPSALGWTVGVVDRMGRSTLVREQAGLAQGPSQVAAKVHTVSDRDRRGARHGDLVLIRPLHRSRRVHGERRRGAAHGSRRQARARGSERQELNADPAVVVRILSRARSTMVGWLDRRGAREWAFWSFDPKLAADAKEVVVLDPPREARDGELVVLSLEQRTREGRQRARVLELLGLSSEAGADLRAVLRHHGFAQAFPAEVLRETEEIEPRPTDEERLDLRDQLVVTIDGADAKDFDDAISVVKLRGGGHRAWIHIADVAHFVPPGSATDREASRRGTSAYFPGYVVPMLPPRLSEDLCSLRPEERRFVVSVELRFDARGARLESKYHLAEIRSAHRLTYEQVESFFRNHDEGQAGDGELPRETRSLLLAARTLARHLRAQRIERGALDFDLPSVRLDLDPSGAVRNASPAPRLEAHRLIEELMLAANEAVAETLERAIDKEKRRGRRTASNPLYRVHPSPRAEDLESIYELCSGLGIDVEAEGWTHREAWDATWLSDLMAQVSGRADAAVIEQLIVRALQQARYAESCDGHYALATRHYCHFTSPIRRYPDLVVHRSLRTLLGVPGAVDGAEPDRAQHLSRLERVAESAERELKKWKLLRYLAGKVGSVWQGMITGVEDFGLFVVLDELLIDGLVTVDRLEDDYYELDRRRHRLVGRGSRKSYRLGDAVHVRVEEVDERRRRLMLVMVREPGTKDKASRRPSDAARRGTGRAPRRDRVGRRPRPRRG